MKTVHEISDLTGLSIRTLQYYDNIGLLKPSQYSASGYRLYDDDSLTVLQQIMLFRELEFPLKDIKTIISDPDFDKNKALEDQIELLRLKRDHIDKLIVHAKKMLEKGGNAMSFDVYDKKKLKEYAEKAKKSWGNTTAYKEYERKTEGRSDEENAMLGNQLMDIFREFGRIRSGLPESPEAQEKVSELKGFITDHYYKCTDVILKGLGQMYAAGGEFTENIDKVAGEGTASFVNKAIQIFAANSGK